MKSRKIHPKKQGKRERERDEEIGCEWWKKRAREIEKYGDGKSRKQPIQCSAGDITRRVSLFFINRPIARPALDVLFYLPLSYSLPFSFPPLFFLLQENSPSTKWLWDTFFIYFILYLFMLKHFLLSQVNGHRNTAFSEERITFTSEFL